MAAGPWLAGGRQQQTSIFHAIATKPRSCFYGSTYTTMYPTSEYINLLDLYDNNNLGVMKTDYFTTQTHKQFQTVHKLRPIQNATNGGFSCK